MPELTQIPVLNATLNLCATICLLSGFISIKKKNEKIHKIFMVNALLFSTFFLGFYLYYHAHIGSKKFMEEGMVKIIYYIILFPHIILAAVMVPFILLTFYHAARKNWEVHKKFARITFPMWLYVSITGVLIYFMLYVWYPS